jgi:3-oxoacyl-(acyl-carrier-protein) synthase
LRAIDQRIRRLASGARFVMGEGAVLVLEERSRVIARGAKI